ncbi:MBL fold metallo-hydrolase [Legionella brunensis]|uniref:Metal-dependent hydrolase of the beta-lactamase superfamily transporter III n=1 Tax=Legionella brunensis TaxID=29422 RepID=A0A0W0S407_9GAMM|nr:MBL fold metallo-hydrolase [Legionella brunensis]KTC77833.1 metal-dependent hydrolase of the beta-lactamase superfamily transporter III [Legionella brunensis]
MKLLFLGVSSALTVGKDKFHSNMLLESKSSRKFLIDCGSDIRHSLYAQGYSHTDIEAVYVSHLHADHAGGLEWLGFSKFFIEKKIPALYTSPDLVHKLWQNVLSGGMMSLENEQAGLETFFEVMPIDNNCFTWENHLFQLIKTYHTFNNHKLLPSYGLLIEGDTKSIFISTDTRLHRESLLPIYEKVDLIFNDCEISEQASGQHAHYSDLRTLDSKIKKKMWLYHYNQGKLPEAEKDGFLGFVTQGQLFNF